VAETYKQLMVRTAANCFFEDDRATPPAKIVRSARLRKFLARFSVLTAAERQLVAEVVKGERARVTCGDKQYAAKRTQYGWSLVALDTCTERIVNCELTECSCGDSKFRRRTCKHILALRTLT
jgi:hypothetical protein